MRVQVGGGIPRGTRLSGIVMAGRRRRIGHIVALRLRRAVLVGTRDLLRGDGVLRGRDIVRVVRFAAGRAVAGLSRRTRSARTSARVRPWPVSANDRAGMAARTATARIRAAFMRVLLERSRSVDHSASDPDRLVSNVSCMSTVEPAHVSAMFPKPGLSACQFFRNGRRYSAIQTGLPHRSLARSLTRSPSPLTMKRRAIHGTPSVELHQTTHVTAQAA